MDRNFSLMATCRYIAAILPCYKVKEQVLHVIDAIPPEINLIVCVDDCCPQKSGEHIERNCNDPRVRVVKHKVNQGVGGAVVTGYRYALNQGAMILIKIDGDGQMDPQLAMEFANPILRGEADYTKGNRFHEVANVRSMPKKRMFGNAVLSFVTKLSTGYWNIFDPTNGYTAISSTALMSINLGKLSKRYFFESDILCHLNIARAVVRDVPMKAVYGDEQSNLHIRNILLPFIYGNLKNFYKRLFYNYLLRDFNVASAETLLGIVAFFGGFVFGVQAWIHSIATGTPATAGTVMIAALPTIAGLQLLLSALNYDVFQVPSKPISKKFFPDTQGDKVTEEKNLDESILIEHH